MNYLLIIAFVGWSLSAVGQTVVGQTAVGQTAASRFSLDGAWAFRTDPNDRGEAAGWFQPSSGAIAGDSLPVPGNWDLRNEYAHYAGKGWYRRTLNAPADWKGKVVRLCFDGVYHDSKVWLNGRLLGSNNSGFLPFEFEVTDLLNAGGENTVVVCADNTFRRGAIWNWGGIRRSVTLEVTEPVRLVRQHIFPTVDLARRTAAVKVKVWIRNHGGQDESVGGEVTLSAPGGFRKALPFTATVPARGMREITVGADLTKEQVHLWHFDDPFLYTAQATLRFRQRAVPPLSDRFGLRKIEVDNQTYAFKLNGESIRPMGFNLVPDDRTTGNSLPLWRIKEDVDKLKELGANMARLTHLPLPKEMLDYMDERGIMTFAEIPLWGFDRLADKNVPIAREWLERMVTRDFNHPCILGWSVGNEIGHYPTTLEYVAEATRHARALDPSRLAVMVSHTAQRTPDAIQYSDLGLINKYGKNIGQLADQIHALYPNKVLFYAEYGYGQLQEDLNGDVEAKAMVDSIRNRPYLIGGSLWTFNDYRSGFVGTKELSENRPWGVVDVYRQPKQAWYSFRRETAPIRAVSLEQLSRAGGKTKATVALTPRRVLDLPAYTISDYLLVWKATDREGRTSQGGYRRLPSLKPGDAVFRQTFEWPDTGRLASVRLSLVSPLNYSVYDTTLYFAKPQTPAILAATGGRGEQNNVRPNDGFIRVSFAPAPDATGYKLRYGKNGLTEETPVTHNHFADISNLVFDETYRVAVVGVNSAGESPAGEGRSVRIEQTGYAPPAIQYVEAADGGFFVGYATQADDYVFEVQYTQKAGDYGQAPKLRSPTKGTLFVPGLTNGQPYFFRLRRIKHNSSFSDWSEERTVTPDGQQLPEAPLIRAVLRQPTEALVCFDPVKKAVGYVLEYRPAGGRAAAAWTTIDINSAQTGYFRVGGLDKNKTYQFRMAARNANGASGYSSSIDSHDYAQSRRN